MRSATPLIALNAVAIDTETTGLDPRQARIVEIAAVRVSRGHIEAGKGFRRLVNPGEPIPRSAVRIHGIDDGAVAGAPDFAHAWPDFARRIDGLPLVGHSLGFDMAIIERECARVGLEPPSPPLLDVALLSRLVAPALPDHSLEGLASRLGVPIEGRHSALGDATAAAKIFCALIPLLRKSDIRTLAEAQKACRALAAKMATSHVSGLAEPSAPVANEIVDRIDSHPFRHRVRDVMTAPAQFLARNASLGDALSSMMREKISSVFVGERESPPERLGIVTERDALRAIERLGPEALGRSLVDLMTRPVVAVGEGDFIYVAAARMNRFEIRHLAVIDERGGVVGALSARDLLKSAPGQAVSLGDEIDHCEDAPSLAAAWGRLPGLVKALRADGMDGPLVAAVVSEEIGRATMAAARISERRMREAGHGDAPCPYAVAVLGSAGRGESLLAFDQDNAIVFEAGEPDGSEDRWFAALGRHLADILHEIGMPYCKGDVMASNPRWRGSLSTWRRRIADWTGDSSPEDLLAVDIFFDLRPVSGQRDLANAIRREAFDAAAGEAAFCKLLADPVGKIEPGLTLFGRVKTKDGRIDLKRAGLFGIVAAARALAVRRHVMAHSTSARLAEIKAQSTEGETDLDSLIEAHRTFLDLIVDRQVADIGHGVPPSNAILVKPQSRHDLDRLRRALHAVRNLDFLVRELLF